MKDAFHRHANVCCAGLLALAFVMSISTSAAAEWRGWRGGEARGLSTTPGPLTWSPDENIRWKAEVPGKGWSSPIVTQEAVYLSTAYLTKQVTLQQATLHWLQYLAMLTIACLGTTFVLRFCRRTSGNVFGISELIGLTTFTIMMVTLSAIVLFGQSFQKSPGPVRIWIATCFCASMCIAIAGMYPSRFRTKLPIGIALICCAFVFVAGFPDLFNSTNASSAEVISWKFRYATRPLFLLTVFAFPFVMGLWHISRYYVVRTSRKRLRSIIRWAAAFIAFVLVISLALHPPQMLLNFEATSATSHAAPVPWWAFGGSVAILIATLIYHRVARSARWTNLALVLSATLVFFTGLLRAAEHLVSNSPYLAKALGGVTLIPVLGWESVGAFVVIWLAAVTMLVVRDRLRHQQPAAKVSRVFQCTALALATLFCLSNYFASESTEFVRAIVSVDRNGGKVNWVCEGLSAPREQKYSTSVANPTPVTDGERVYAYFGTAGLMCVDASGSLLWTCRDLPYRSIYGVGVSPVLCKDKIIILSESDCGAYLAAVDSARGTICWRTTRQVATHPIGSGNSRTPLVMEIRKRKTIVVWGYEDIAGYDPDTGEQWWSHSVPHVGGDCVASMVSDQTTLVLSGTERSLALSVEKLGTDDDPQLWSTKSRGPCTPSPVLADKMLFMVSDDGIATSIRMDDGKRMWRRRICGEYTASPVVLGDCVYFCDTEGITTILKAADEYVEVGRCCLDEPVSASFAAADGQLFIRTWNHLLCVRQQSDAKKY